MRSSEGSSDIDPSTVPPQVAPVVRRAISITGIVQGVGFRPFVYGLARQLCLRGFVRNRVGGALIEVEGDAGDVERFVVALQAAGPRHGRIADLTARDRPPCGDDRFRIEPSELSASSGVAVSPDIATCDDCLRELFDPRDRRHRYPFITCAQCGPRLTIVTGTPYDRERTTMAAFVMCHGCREEYENPLDRRFHAQTIACAACGPRLRILGGQRPACDGDEALAVAVHALRSGQIVAVKGIGGYHLGCHAANSDAVAELRRRKARDAKPFAIMVADTAAAEALCEISPAERHALTSGGRPIVLLRRRPGAAVADGVAPGMATLGVMLPYTPLHALLLCDVPGRALVMTSGNRAEEPIVHEDAEAGIRLAGIADIVVAHDRPIRVRCDDSVTRVVGGRRLPVRRARGEAPSALTLPGRLARPTLALGGHLKVALALGEGSDAIPSHHIGDLDEYETYRAYVAAIEHYQRLTGISPRRLVHDLHPDYASTRYAIEQARETGMERLAVQHHHAHMASCMAEHHLRETAIGVCFDGAGWGGDGTVWGGEFLIGDARAFWRAAHLRRVAMPGGETAIREPWRMAVAYLRDAGVAIEDSALARRLDPVRLRLIDRLLDRGFNAPLTSSAGRLFDAVAALVGLSDPVSYEGQAAMRLEAMASEATAAGVYPFAVEESGGRLEVDSRPLVRAVVADVGRDAVPATIARRFHATLAEVVEAVCRRIRDAWGVDTVVLSGGVFMNAVLTEEVPERLRRAGFRAYRHEIVPPNDGGLCLGQLAIAAARDAAGEAA